MKTITEIQQHIEHIANNINSFDAVCSNKATEAWFDGVRAALAIILTFIEE